MNQPVRPPNPKNITFQNQKDPNANNNQSTNIFTPQNEPVVDENVKMVADIGKG